MITHHISPDPLRTDCAQSPLAAGQYTRDWAKVTCADCLARRTAKPTSTSARDDIRDAAHAWLKHQGYTTDDIEVGETDTHEARGCEWCPNHMTWDCIDNETGLSRHPMWDALEEAVAFVLLLDELGWRKVDPAADTRTEWGNRHSVSDGSTYVVTKPTEERVREIAEDYRGARPAVSRTVTTGPWQEVEQ
ncbi:hypothetical protein [Rhodococcus sp. SJ-2]